MRWFSIVVPIVVSAVLASELAVIAHSYVVIHVYTSFATFVPLAALPLFVLFTTALFCIFPDGPLVIRTRAGEERRETAIRRYVDDGVHASLAAVMSDAASRYPAAVVTKALEHKLAQLKEAHPDRCASALAAVIGQLYRDLERANTDLAAFRTTSGPTQHP